MKKSKLASNPAAGQVEKFGLDNFSKGVVKLVIGYLIFVVIYMIIFLTILMISKVPSGSMENTIMTGDVVIGTRFGIDADEIERYDILIFNPPDEPDINYIKRVIGLPGETVEIKNGSVYVDGVEADDSFVRNPMNRKGDGVYVVPEGCYFFLGDNRNQSKDSRFWKQSYVPIKNIKAKARFIIFPFKSVGYME